MAYFFAEIAVMKKSTWFAVFSAIYDTAEITAEYGLKFWGLNTECWRKLPLNQYFFIGLLLFSQTSD